MVLWLLSFGVLFVLGNNKALEVCEGVLCVKWGVQQLAHLVSCAICSSQKLL